ncbi:hypothetical protein KAR91_67635 [Candidatus Pacearchaeota archaeon]|nr:hypothetical protein [Candidatus Pacearchaeota archaeon]
MNQSAECVSNFKLEEGEMVCNQCEGSGKSWIYTTLCSKCQGHGKVDWVENIVGRKPALIDTTGSNNVSFGYQAGSILSKTTGSDNVITNALAQQLANKIDQEIMETLVAESEQNNKMKAAAVLSEIGRCNF